MKFWTRRQPEVVHPSKDERLVMAVARNELRPRLVLLCSEGVGRPKMFASILDVPLKNDCSCGVQHDVVTDDIEVTFEEV